VVISENLPFKVRGESAEDRGKATCQDRLKRKKLAVLFAEQQLSNRKIAKTLNINERTVRRDSAANAASSEKNLSQNNGAKHATAAFAAPALLEGERAARLITNKAETYEVKQAKRDERERDRFEFTAHQMERRGLRCERLEEARRAWIGGRRVEAFAQELPHAQDLLGVTVREEQIDQLRRRCARRVLRKRFCGCDIVVAIGAHRSGPPGFWPMGGAEPSPLLAAPQVDVVAEARRLTAYGTAMVKEARRNWRRC
jgi:hypothetical protein